MSKDLNFDELVSRLRTNQGDNLVSVIVHGSGVTAQKHRRSDLQFLIVTQSLGAGDLQQIRPVAHWLTAAGYQMPVFFTAKELNDSLDVYPIEFRQMKRVYRVLYGSDLLADREPSKANLRWETELELRGKLLRLRSLYLPASLSSSDLLKLMTESIVSFVRFMRPVLELAGEEPPADRLETVQRIHQRLGIDTTPLVRILHLREEPGDLKQVEVQNLFAGYLDCITRVIEAVNNM
ncbi:MAG TPA: hypothetical protein VJ302_00280 [Blastocatellia bacterium]|nr:hypothetical protein [Blastocatellia bacterium]